MMHSKWVRAAYAAAVMAISAGSVLLVAQAPEPVNNPNFTGGKVYAVEDKWKAQIAHFRFEPGARTKWHSHSGGQILLVEEGVTHHQNKGGPVMELRANETYYAQPGVVHWHGAAPDQATVQFNTTRGDITWLEEVSDRDYGAKPKR